jgi:glyceraldehyde-3-phosphate dehydrogenase (NADP+)
MEEQFGPVVPVTTYSNLQEIFEYLATSPYGQQASVFGKDIDQLSMLIDVLVNQVCRVNLNCQCQRGPDTFPFTGIFTLLRKERFLISHFSFICISMI